MQNKLDMILNFTQDVIFEFDEVGTCLNIWTSNEELLVRPKKELIGNSALLFLPEDKVAYLELKIKEVQNTKESAKLEYSVETPDGVRFFRGRMVPLKFNEVTTFVLHVKNVTGEKNKELTLTNIEKLAKMGTWELDLRTNKKTCSKVAYEIYEIEPEESLDFGEFLKLFDIESQKIIDEAIEHLKETHETYDLELTLDKTSTKKIVRVTGYPIMGADKKVFKIAGLLQDITENNQLSKAFEDQKNKLTRIIQQAPGTFYQFKWTKEGEISFPYVSENITKLLGYTPDSLIDGSVAILDIVHNDDQESWAIELQRSIESLSDFEWRGRLLNKNGKHRWIHCQSTPKLQKDGSIIWDGIIFDFTKRKRAEDQLEEKQRSVNHQLKLASLGELAAGVAHEINNPLAILNNVLERIASQKEKDNLDKESLKTLIDYALDASNRIQKITSGLRTFTRADVQTSKKFNITEALSSTVSLMTELYRSQDVEIEFENEDSEHYIFGNRGRLDQVLVNLVSNAKDAIGENANGKITIKLICDDDDCHIIVSDNGCGIPEEHKEKIFDPFFSTKEVGKGTGIGLSLANSIIQDHGGTIEFETSVSGTTFTARFPKYKDSGDYK